MPGEKPISVSQSDISAETFIGRDQDNSVKNYTFITQPGADEFLSVLNQALINQIKEQSVTDKKCAEIEEFLTTESDDVIGLESKLVNGGLTAHLHYAKRCKEKFAQHVDKFIMYEAAQSINAYLLEKIESGYQASVLPHLATTAPAEKLDLMRRSVSEPIRNALGNNPMKLFPSHIDGMVFFLTGKCRIKWDAETA